MRYLCENLIINEKDKIAERPRGTGGRPVSCNPRKKEMQPPRPLSGAYLKRKIIPSEFRR